jgi:hypothetical protein
MNTIAFYPTGTEGILIKLNPHEIIFSDSRTEKTISKLNGLIQSGLQDFLLLADTLILSNRKYPSKYLSRFKSLTSIDLSRKITFPSTLRTHHIKILRKSRTINRKYFIFSRNLIRGNDYFIIQKIENDFESGKRSGPND